MNNFNKSITENNLIKLCLAISLVIFFGFGLFHLSKFETVDEHFWKDERIKKYYRGIKEGITEGKWGKTRINDKPGITVAIVSGIPGLLIERDPEANRIRDEKITDGDLYTVYDEKITEKINLAFRLPLLIFNTFFLLILFWLLKRVIPPPLAVLTIVITAFSPVLIGMSQVINPDTLLWSFFAAAIFSYLAFLKKEKKKFLVLTIIFTGFSLLSKYTASILFPIFVLIFISKLFIDYKKIDDSMNTSTYIKTRIFEWFIILGSTILMYGLFMPAAFQKIKHLWNGTINSPAFAPIFLPLTIFLLVLLAEALFLRSRFSKYIFAFLFKYKQIVFRGTSLMALFLFLIVLINPWLSTPVVPLDNVKENAFYEKELLFPMLDNYPRILKLPTKLAIEAGPFVFSLLPISIILLLAFWIKIIWKGLEKNQLIVFFVTLIIPAYFSMLLFAGVLANPRYSIILYPLLALLVAMAIAELAPKPIKNKFIVTVSLIIISTGFLALWQIKPFYLNYENFLLPKKYVLTDAWGYGSYEAAQYLNSLPNPEKIVIWADRSAICQFIKGRCIRNYKIDLSETIPDYFVFTRRGSIRHRFIWKKPELALQNTTYYYKQNPIWEIHIGDRPKNFVKIVPFIE